MSRLILGLTAALLLMVASCEEKGPMEEAGEAIDEAVEDTKRKVEDAAD